MKPVGRVPAPASQESQDIRQSCKSRLQALKGVYDRKRTAFQNSPDSGALKSFETYCTDHKMKAKLAAEEEARLAAERQLAQNQLCSNLAGVLSLGLSKHRVTQSDLGGAIPTEAVPQP